MQITLKELKKLIQLHLILESEEESFDESQFSPENMKIQEIKNLVQNSKLPNILAILSSNKISGSAATAVKNSFLKLCAKFAENVVLSSEKVDELIDADLAIRDEIKLTAKQIFKNIFLDPRYGKMKIITFLLFELQKGVTVKDIPGKFKNIADKIFKSEIKIPVSDSSKEKKHEKTFHLAFNENNALNYMQQIQDDLVIQRKHGTTQKSEYGYYTLPFPIKNYQSGHLAKVQSKLDSRAYKEAKELQKTQREIGQKIRDIQKNEEGLTHERPLHVGTDYYDMTVEYTQAPGIRTPVSHNIDLVPGTQSIGNVEEKLADRIEGFTGADYYIRMRQIPENELTEEEKETLTRMLGLK